MITYPHLLALSPPSGTAGSRLHNAEESRSRQYWVDSSTSPVAFRARKNSAKRCATSPVNSPRRGSSCGWEPRFTAQTLLDEAFDEIVIAIGVVPRLPAISGIDHPTVVSYLSVLRDAAPVGQRVAIVGARGIGFDVAEYVSQPGPPTSLDIAAFNRHRGIDSESQAPGGLVDPDPMASPRTVYLLQRKASKVGAGPGVTTGWIHRAELAQRGVHMLAGVSYRRIDDEGLHISIDGQDRTQGRYHHHLRLRCR